MNALVLMIAASTVGIEVGWVPLPEGGVEYILQIEPDLVDTLLKKQDLLSTIPAGLDVRSFRVTVGTAKLPRQNAPGTAAAGATPPGGAAPPGASPAGLPPGMMPPNTATPSGAGSPAGSMPATTTPNSVIPLGPPPDGAPASPRRGQPSSPRANPQGPAPTTDFPLGAASAAGAGALAGGADGAASGDGGAGSPGLGAPTDTLGRKERDAVSRALDDPAAPGRAPAGDTSQPKLTPGEMASRGRDGDMNNGAMGGGAMGGPMLASAHEANRPSEFDRGLNAASPSFPNNFGNGNGNGFGQNTNGQNMNNGPAGRNYNSPGERMENANAASAARPVEPVEKPWPTLIFTVTMLLASVSLNFFLGWVAYDSRFRYRELLAQSTDMPLPV